MRIKYRLSHIVIALFGLSCVSALAAPQAGSPAARVAAMEAIYPPWLGGANNDALDKGLSVTAPPFDTMADFHGSVNDPALVIYASGNNFYVYGKLVDAFGAKYSQWKGKIFYETLPPGLLYKQVLAGGTITSGNMTFTAKPDVMMAEQRVSLEWIQQGFLSEPLVSFATNDLAIMVQAGNPQHIKGLPDLGADSIALAMPDPASDTVSVQIRRLLVKAGGEALDKKVYESKFEDGSTVLVGIHHRRIPLLLLQGIAQAGVVWKSEAIFQEQIGANISHVVIPPQSNVQAIYSAGVVTGTPHLEAAKAWVDFMATDEAFAIYAPYGFTRYRP